MIGNDLDLYLRTNLGGLVEVRIVLALELALELVFVVSSLMRFEESLDDGELRLMDDVLLVVVEVAAALLEVAAVSPLVATIDGLKHTCLNS